MKKLILALASVMMLATAAVAGNSTRGATDVPVAQGLESALNAARLKLVELESDPDLTVGQFKRGQAEIIKAFIKERENAYLTLRATEILECSAHASRPGLWKGRNTDSCTVVSDTGTFAGWKYEQHTAKLLGQHSSGDNKYEVNVLEGKSGVRLYVWVRSSKHDSFQGAGYLNQRVTVTYAMSPAEARKRSAAEAGSLMVIS